MNNFEGSCTQTDPEVFFPEQGRGDMSKLARSICAACIELEPCRADAIANNYEAYGIQGGLTPTMRHAARRNRNV